LKSFVFVGSYSRLNRIPEKLVSTFVRSVSFVTFVQSVTNTDRLTRGHCKLVSPLVRVVPVPFVTFDAIRQQYRSSHENTGRLS
jgi:hypothetical protein